MPGFLIAVAVTVALTLIAYQLLRAGFPDSRRKALVIAVIIGIIGFGIAAACVMTPYIFDLLADRADA